MKALEGLRVLDVSESVAGQFCARLLADYGAEVILAEPPAGSSLRRVGPFHPVCGDRSLLFAHLNHGKSSMTLDWSVPSGRERLSEVAATMDAIIVGSAVAAEAPRIGGPQTLIATVTDFGTSGPLANWRASELIHQAMSGVMYDNGKPGAAPLYGCGHRSYYAAGVAAYTALLAALMVRDRDGLTQAISVDVSETAASMNFCRGTQWDYNRSYDPRGENKRPMVFVRCLDRWLCGFFDQASWRRVCEVLGATELLADERLADPIERQRRWPEIIDVFQEKVRDRRADDVVEAVQAVGGVAAAFSPQELVDSQHLAARGFWERIPDEHGDLAILGPVFRMSQTPRAVSGGFPSLGGRDEIGIGRAAPSEDCPRGRCGPATDPEVGAGGTPPLSGVRVLDLTAAWGGPMTGRILAALGAEVIHVEGPGHMDSWRGAPAGGDPSLYPDRDPGDHPYNRSCLFNSQNLGKLSLAIDLKAPQARDAVTAVVSACDLVLSNLAPGALERLGLGYRRLCGLRPDIIVVEMPAFGNTGPLLKHRALGLTMEYACGMASLVGYGDGEPIATGPNYMDPIGAYNAAAACLTALLHRQRTGQGQEVEVAQCEAGMHWIGEELLAAAAGAPTEIPQGNHVRWSAPHDCFPAQGDDEWVVIAVGSDEEWQKLCQVIGRPDLANDQRFSTTARRLKHQEELHDAISSSTRDRDKGSLAATLQESGVCAAPVMNGRDLAGSAYLDARRFFGTFDHPEAGRHRYQGLPFHFGRSSTGPRTAAPCFGEHTIEVLARIGGLSGREVRALLDDGVAVAPSPSFA